MKIVIDENMPYAEALFSQLGEVIPLAGRHIKASDLVDVDGLMIRSVTKVNDALLAQANKLRFVGTATAGKDHVDEALLVERGIHFSSASGCNKVGVAEYVLSCMLVLAQQSGESILDKTVGIIGAGQVGSYLAYCLQGLGIKVLLNDPPRQREGDPRKFTPLNVLLQQADVVTLHTPLIHYGEDATYHLISESKLNQLRGDQVLINASRGAVVDNQALKQRLMQGDGFKAVLDVFESEPNVDLELLPYLSFATPHIAGYGLEGKARGTTMIFNAFSKFIKSPLISDYRRLLPVAPIPEVKMVKPWSYADLHTLTQLVYDVRKDDAQFRHQMKLAEAKDTAQLFDAMRKNYWDRREYGSVTIKAAELAHVDALQAIGFKIEV